MTQEVNNLEREAIERLLAFEEGYRAKPYQDNLGFWTIGHGHLIPGPNTEANARAYHQKLLDLAKAERVTIDVVLQEMFAEDIDNAIEGAKMVFGTDWLLAPPSVRIALVSLAFQLGVTKLLGYEQTKAMIRNKEYDKLSASMSSWLLAKQAPSRTTRYQLLFKSWRLKTAFVYDMIVGFTKGSKHER